VEKSSKEDSEGDSFDQNTEVAMALDIEKLRALQPPAGVGFKIRRLGHVVLQVTDLERSLLFYTQVLGFKITEIYSEELQPGGFAFLHCHTDHHSIALVGTGTGQSRHAELHHIAFEVGTLAEVFKVRERLREQGAKITFEGRRRAGCQIAVEFLDPDGHCLEIYWGLDQIGTSGYVRPASEWKGIRTLEAAVANPVVGQDTGTQK
jgi:catechol 2,3-dioxygenase-like lactoylglutathione lyase family enzyme